MTPKQAAFVQHYLIDSNATQAAVRAGYSVKTAYSIGEENLRKPEIRAAIDAAMADTAARLGITAERVMRERSRLAFFDPRRLFASNGEPIPIHELDDDTAAALAGLDVHEEFAGTGEARVFVGYTKKYKLASKDPSLAALEKYFGLNEKAIRCPLPVIETSEDCSRAQSAIIQAVATGKILPSDAETLAGLIEQQRRSLETSDLIRRMHELERILKEKGTL
jgi:phage terminase small subunit